MNKKLKRIIISSGMNIILMSILLIGVSTAKYTQATVAYASLGAARYDLILLGKDPETGEMVTGDGSPQQFGKTLLSDELEPGMQYSSDSEHNTAKVFPFTIANGTCEDDVSEIALEYTVTLRATRNLPLTYMLVLGSTLYESEDPVALDKYGKPITDAETAEMDENGIAWYEWSFKDIGNTDEGTLETDSAPVFSLCGGVVDSNAHALIIEWPVLDEDGNATGHSKDYMSEIELLEICVTSSSKNGTSEVETITLDTDDERIYSKGIILIGADETVGTILDYEVDYRAFKQEGTSLVYEFNIENGVGKESGATARDVGYTVSMAVPELKQEDTADTGTTGYTYVLEVYNTETEEWETLPEVSGYDLKGWNVFKVNEDRTAEDPVSVTDMKYDAPAQYSELLYECSTEESKYRLMTEMRFGSAADDDNDAADDGTERMFRFSAEGSGEDGTETAQSENFRIRIEGVDGSIPSYVQMLGRVKISVSVRE